MTSGLRLPRLAAFEIAWADAAYAAIFPAPPRSVLAHGIAQMEPGRFLDDLLRSVPLEPSLGLRLALWIVALAPLFTIRRLATIASLAEEDRERVLDRLLTSPIYAVRQLVASFEAIGSLLYAQSAAIRAQMNEPLRVVPIVALAAKKKTTGEVGPHEHAAE